MAMPSGWRSSAPAPVPNAIGSVPSSAASVVMMIGRKRTSAASRIAVTASAPSRRRASAKSTIMIAFFLTMPISSRMPMIAITLRVHVEPFEREQRADAGRRQAGENRDRVDVALVEHAEQDVDRQHRGEQQRALAGQRLLEQLRVAGEVGDDVAGQVDAALERVDVLDRLAERHVGREVERDRHRRLLRLPVDLQRPDRALQRRDLVERHQRARGRGDAHAAERAGVVLELVRRLEDDLVIVGRREDRRDLPGAEGVVERVAHGVDADAEGGGLVAVDVDAGLRVGDLQVAVDVAQARQLAPSRAPSPARS